jgi:hypothetical protein
MSYSQDEVLACIRANPGIRRSEIDDKVKFQSAHKLRALERDGKIRHDRVYGKKSAYGGMSWFIYYATEDV